MKTYTRTGRIDKLTNREIFEEREDVTMVHEMTREQKQDEINQHQVRIDVLTAELVQMNEAKQ